MSTQTRADVLRITETKLQFLIDYTDEIIAVIHLLTNPNVKPHLQYMINIIYEIQGITSWRTGDRLRHFLECHPRRSLERVLQRLIRREFYIDDSLTIKNWRTLLQTKFELNAIQMMVTKIYLFMECPTQTLPQQQ